jgi:hypothetical protein
MQTRISKQLFTFGLSFLRRKSKGKTKKNCALIFAGIAELPAAGEVPSTG